jgi:hypothetical protein
MMSSRSPTRLRTCATSAWAPLAAVRSAAKGIGPAAGRPDLHDGRAAACAVRAGGEKCHACRGAAARPDAGRVAHCPAEGDVDRCRHRPLGDTAGGYGIAMHIPLCIATPSGRIGKISKTVPAQTDACSCRHPTTVLSGGPKSAKIHVSSETIWGIPVNMSKNGGSICPRIK